MKIEKCCNILQVKFEKDENQEILIYSIKYTLSLSITIDSIQYIKNTSRKYIYLQIYIFTIYIFTYLQIYDFESVWGFSSFNFSVRVSDPKTRTNLVFLRKCPRLLNQLDGLILLHQQAADDRPNIAATSILRIVGLNDLQAVQLLAGQHMHFFQGLFDNRIRQHRRSFGVFVFLKIKMIKRKDIL